MDKQRQTYNYVVLFSIGLGAFYLPLEWILVCMYGGLFIYTHGQEYGLETMIAVLWGVYGFFHMLLVLLGLTLYETIKTPKKRVQLWKDICETVGHPYDVCPSLKTIWTRIHQWSVKMNPTQHVTTINILVNEIVGIPYIQQLSERMGLLYGRITHTLTSEESKPVPSPSVKLPKDIPTTGDPHVDSLVAAITSLHRLEKEHVNLNSFIEMERIMSTLEHT